MDWNSLSKKIYGSLIMALGQHLSLINEDDEHNEWLPLNSPSRYTTLATTKPINNEQHTEATPLQQPYRYNTLNKGNNYLSEC